MELSGLNEVKRWVLSFGEYARVLQPPELIDMVANTVERIDKLYKSSG
ncbi:MAG TPA: WYL domain-containing protein, partial [Firmicutes bacterium]|nr:WYL domain-containing protein [Bacillota bacterium]